MDENVTMDKDGVLWRMSASYERIEEALDALTPQQWVAPRELGAWSARDIVAHLTYWLDRLVAEVDAVGQQKPPKEPSIGLSDADVDAANTLAAAAHGDETASQTHGAFRRSFAELMDMVRLLTWDDLAAVGRFEWLGQTPLWRVIAEDTWEHFDEHLPEIEWARSIGSQS